MITAGIRALAMTLMLATGLMPGLAAAETSDPPPPQTIAALDLPRYMGQWYEIARFPNIFQEKCLGFTTASYHPLEDGRVEVINRCRVADGSTTEAIGIARLNGGPGSPRLEVRFAPAWLSFIPAVWGDYWVIDLDPEYRLAAVSDSRRKYLWILSRTPKVDPAAYAALMQRLSQQHFDLRQLRSTRQQE